MEPTQASKEVVSLLPTNTEKNEDDHETSTLTTTSSNNCLFEFEHHWSSSSSSELHLSLILQPSEETSSLSLTALDNATIDDDSMSLTVEQSSSEEESVLYLRLSDELNIAEATLDSDLEHNDRFSSWTFIRMHWLSKKKRIDDLLLSPTPVTLFPMCNTQTRSSLPNVWPCHLWSRKTFNFSWWSSLSFSRTWLFSEAFRPFSSLICTLYHE